MTRNNLRIANLFMMVIKSTVRAKMADRLVTEMENPDIDVMICRAPEFLWT